MHTCLQLVAGSCCVDVFLAAAGCKGVTGKDNCALHATATEVPHGSSQQPPCLASVAGPKSVSPAFIKWRAPLAAALCSALTSLVSSTHHHPHGDDVVHNHLSAAAAQQQWRRQMRQYNSANVRNKLMHCNQRPR
jgi:hypothetical protein